VRFKYTVVVLLIAVVGTTTMPVTGQEEPLPVIQAKTFFEPVTPSIALAVEPIRDLAQQTTLVDAARANDYVTFDALYREAPIPAFAMLHELWTFSMTDPIGAFYGEETYARLARAYPGYARYIEEFRIVDSNGNVFYPTSETRAFLLDRAVEGRPAPRVQIAEGTGTPASPPAEQAASRRRAPAQPTVKTAPASVAPAKAAARDAAASAGEDAGAPKVKVVAAKAVVESAPVVVAEPQPQPTPAPVAITRPEPATITVDNSFGTRGIFLLLIGILGIGVLAMMLRTPSELPASIMTPPADTAAPPPPVEPLRRPTAATPPPPPAAGKNRAGGSHG
jgi:hypothetical protein